MSDSKDKDRAAQPADSPPGDARPVKRSGRVAFDSRNNPIWEWQLETGVYSRDVTTQKLKKLDLGDLSIAESAIHKRPPGLSAAASSIAKPGTPLQLPGEVNAQVNAADVVPKVSRPPAPRRPVTPASAAPKPSTLSKIGQWFKGNRKTDDDYE